jgi:acyl-CoA synthetase (AMP-forming)/AMP-acid ligase II
LKPPDSIPAWVGAVVSGQGRRPALFDGPQLWSYDELWGRSGRAAAALLADRAFAPGRRVGIVGANSRDYLAGYLGVMRAGGVVVPLNDRLPPEELREQLEFVDAAGCILAQVGSDLGDAFAPCPSWEAKALEADPPDEMPAIDPRAESTVLLTSGSTGAPKGVVHTHATLLHAALQVALALPFAADDINVAFLPFFASIPEQVLPTLLHGAALDLLPRFDPEAVSAACERATTFDSVPTIVARLLEDGDHRMLNRLRWIAFASEPMPPAVLERWWERVPNVSTYEFYGMTEMLTITYAGPAQLASDHATVGAPYPTSKVEIVDAGLNPVESGEEGEVTCESPARMQGYLGDAEATAAALTPSGAIRTGDLGRFDEFGRLRLTGRLKDLIISGGMNIAPAEIEAAACRHPNVAAAAAVGIPDERWGETPVVVAVPAHGNSLTATELLAHCRSELTSHKRPSAAAVIAALPVTGIGKSAKAQLRDAILDGEVDVVRTG